MRPRRRRVRTAEGPPWALPGEVIEPPYRPRFMTEGQLTELINLWHLARVAVAGTADTSSYARQKIAAKWFHQKYPQISETAAYKDLSGSLEGQPLARQ